MFFKGFQIKNYDVKLILMVGVLSTIGVFAIGSAQPSLEIRQLGGVIAGVVIMLFVSFVDYHFILKLYWVIYILNLLLLTLVLAVGEVHNNAKRWLIIGGVQFQPSEFAKILLILFFAAFIMKHKERLNTMPILGGSVLLFLVPLFLVFEQPDLSTSIMLILIFCVCLFSGGLSHKIIWGVLLVAIPTFAILFHLTFSGNSQIEILRGFQMNRVLAYLYPEEYPDLARQQNNSVTAIASGMLDGKGYRNNEITSVKNGNFLSEDQTDFIFAVIGEEFGFRGSAIVIILLFLIAIECISIGRRAPDTAGTVICGGMGGLIGFQSFINIGVATFLLPNTGLPLPFVSYGLTSLLSLFVGMGVVLNVRLQVKRGNSSGDEEYSFIMS